MLDYKDVVEEMRAEFDALEADVGARLNAMLDVLVADGPDARAAARPDAGNVAAR